MARQYKTAWCATFGVQLLDIATDVAHFEKADDLGRKYQCELLRNCLGEKTKKYGRKERGEEGLCGSVISDKADVHFGAALQYSTIDCVCKTVT